MRMALDQSVLRTLGEAYIQQRTSLGGYDDDDDDDMISNLTNLKTKIKTTHN